MTVLIDPNAFLYRYNAIVRSNYDGDTVRIWTDLGKGIWEMGTTSEDADDLDEDEVHFPVRLPRGVPHRLDGLNTPELRDKDPEVRERAIAAREFVAERIPRWSRVFVQTVKGEAKGKYGRFLAIIWYKRPDEEHWTNLNKELIATGHAVAVKY